jgi:hypothetical protein
MVWFNKSFPVDGPLGVLKNHVLAAYFCKICIWLAASRMQISFGWSLAACKLGILYCMAACWMQFASGWRPTE